MLIAYLTESKIAPGWWKVYAETVHPTVSAHKSFYDAFHEAMKLNPDILAINVGENTWFEVQTKSAMVTEVNSCPNA